MLHPLKQLHRVSDLLHSVGKLDASTQGVSIHRTSGLENQWIDALVVNSWEK